MNKRILLFVTIVTINLINCSLVYRITGKTLNSYAQDHLVPFYLGTDDIDAICTGGTALGPLVASFERTGASVELATMVAQMGAGVCAERKAQEAELLYIAAVRKGKGEEALDHQAMQIRWHGVAAKRYGDAHNRFLQYFGEWQGKCPSISEDEELYYLVGLSSGLLAILHDFASQGYAGITREVPSVVSQGSKCLDPKRWWGTPLALEAVVWLSVPGATPEGKDPNKQMEEAVKLGDQAGVRLSRAFQIQAAAGKGDVEKIKKLILEHSKSLAQVPPKKEYLFLEAFAENLSRHESDKIWMKEKGHRGPINFSSFPGKKKNTKEEDDLLKDL
ncbi:hypothetical protein ACE5IS_07720 [Leptospira wolffii]|uniref:Uncharacterized protein n=1 Tax=Leptospira wolffii TaxID=409998 RepID=A0A2M9Z8G2_9LEPT|nr:hypothetical protein [Leptospira wolffii]EPG67019.1 hypothetical protein LEP1GSC061_1670 [Leptospira wolffii serovar Khorat str. Khorat-H2]PJZ64711.1 hypothetical protein CH371_16435 [Leptospira wolffii]TGK57004.1 hypothetical protein EHQ32_15635 [Leptospira wolffii]TGK71037.1 hypothetical protein EHQ27_11555 [Leptospira wolffii]TGK75728.1 hypothetical protein EHQ35_05005 [Leptospira wolffii]